jgi:hypothetical protein
MIISFWLERHVYSGHSASVDIPVSGDDRWRLKVEIKPQIPRVSLVASLRLMDRGTARRLKPASA